MKYRIKSEIIGVSAHSMHLVEYKNKWWHRWRRYGNVFRWSDEAQIFINNKEKE